MLHRHCSTCKVVLRWTFIDSLETRWKIWYPGRALYNQNWKRPRLGIVIYLASKNWMCTPPPLSGHLTLAGNETVIDCLISSIIWWRFRSPLSMPAVAKLHHLWIYLYFKPNFYCVSCQSLLVVIIVRFFVHEYCSLFQWNSWRR